MNFTVAFEKATADFRLGREHALLLCADGKTEPIDIATTNGYDGEVRHLLQVLNGEAELGATLDDAVGVTRLLEAEGRSLKTGDPVQLA